MKVHNAFTMIELIFVIVILAILAVVALPKFIGISEEAHKGLCESAVGTMNRTVGLNLWSKSISSGGGGNVTVDAAALAKNIPDYNATDCGALIGLVPGAPAAGDGVYGSPVWVNEGNMTNTPIWEWVKK